LKKKRRRPFEIYIMEENSRGRTWTISNCQEEDSFRTPLAVAAIKTRAEAVEVWAGIARNGAETPC